LSGFISSLNIKRVAPVAGQEMVVWKTFEEDHASERIGAKTSLMVAVDRLGIITACI
jgi:hypothetical protein